MTEHVENVEYDRELEIEQARELNLKQSSVPNCTKVVRLFVVDAERGRTFENIVARENPTRGDVFVVTCSDGELEPKTWLGGKELVGHTDAHHQHRATVPVLTGSDRDQIEWQCDVPFRVSRIEKAAEHHHGFPGYHGPDYPFEKSLDDLNDRGEDSSKPIRSGPTKIIEGGLLRKPIHWKQLYKAHFELQIGGSWKPLDPDFYCDWR